MELLINWEEFLTPYAQAVGELTAKLNAISDEYVKSGVHSPIEYIEGRVKRVASIIGKANKKSVPYGEIAEKIEDIAGVRIICRFVEDIERVTEIIKLRDGFDLKVMEQRDYITNIKPSGYRSFHIIVKYKVMSANAPKEVWVEIQIRTLAMNFWATIEHTLKYKYNGDIPEDVRKRLRNSAEAAHNLDREMSTIRNEITEAKEIIFDKEKLVDGIIKKIQSLYYVAKIEKVNELNREFIDLYQEADLTRLAEFNEKLNAIAKFHRVEYL